MSVDHDSSAPAPSTASVAGGTAIVVLLVLIGLFWIVVAFLQIGAGLANGPGGGALLIAIIGGCNLLVAGYTLSAIKGVVRRSYHAQGSLVLVSVVGAGWGLFATIFPGGWFHLLVVPLNVGVGVLALTNSAYFAPVHDRGREAAPQLPLPAPPAPPPWESPW
jgi:hypothetical protein